MNERAPRFVKLAAVGLAATFAVVAALAAEAPAQRSPSPPQGGEAGFVVSHFSFALADRPASETGACPDGLTQGYRNMGDPFPDRPEFQRRAGEVDSDWIRRVWRVALTDDSIRNVCKMPELGQADARFHTVERDAVAQGIDLDGRDSRVSAGGMCAHSDLRGAGGARGIDNQWYRVVGCGAGFQPGGLANNFDTDMYTGAWGLLITLHGVDDLRNDDSVEVSIAASADPLQLDPQRAALPHATYAMLQDSRFRASARASIVDGVLTSEPFEFNFRTSIGDMFVERPLREARIQATFSADGGMDGYLAGYTPVQAMYDAQYGFRTGYYRNGQPANAFNRVSASVGQRYQYQDTCEGAYHAILSHADGHPDPRTGQCTTISTQYRFQAAPAFVVDEATTSLNEDLDAAPSR